MNLTASLLHNNIINQTKKLDITDKTHLYNLTRCPHPTPAMSKFTSISELKAARLEKNRRKQISGVLPDCIGHLFSLQSSDLVLSLILRSMKNIRNEFPETGDRNSNPSEHANALVGLAPRLCPKDRMVLFLLALNVDVDLKTEIFEMDIEANYFKITRFLRDLQRAVVDFYTDMRISKAQFLARCEELYVLA